MIVLIVVGVILVVVWQLFQLHKPEKITEKKIEDLHKLEGPVLVHQDGLQEWWLKGKLYRVEKPSDIEASHNES